MKISSGQIANACAESEEVDVNPEKGKIRRKDNKALPELNTERRRDAKAAGKGGAAAENGAAENE